MNSKEITQRHNKKLINDFGLLSVSWHCNNHNIYMHVFNLSACKSMCHHIYDWNIIDCDVKQPINPPPQKKKNKQKNKTKKKTHTQIRLITNQLQKDMFFYHSNTTIKFNLFNLKFFLYVWIAYYKFKVRDKKNLINEKVICSYKYSRWGVPSGKKKD